MSLHQTFSVLLYTSGEYKDKTFGVDNTCEAVCRELCKELGIKPISNLLFSLRLKGSTHFLPGCRTVQANEKYEFRLRHQVPKLSEFHKLDKKAYNYYFHQVKYDLINNAIPELIYSNHKNKVVGLAVTSMYIDMLEKPISVKELKKHYKNYLPDVPLCHRMLIKKIISKELSGINNMNHDAYYVKSTYLESINTLAPDYLMEKYSGSVPYLPEDNFDKNGMCTVDVQFLPFHSERPGLSVYYPYKKLWKHVAKIDDIFKICIVEDTVKLNMRNGPDEFTIEINDALKRDSFVSCLATYYRLMVNWTVDLCDNLWSPTLRKLREQRCHGPIGYGYAYAKLFPPTDKQSPPGSYIIRQCERIYENYYIDMVVKPNKIETFKITHEYDRWHLHLLDNNNNKTVQTFHDLIELAQNIQTQSTSLAPSENDKSTSLLLCLPPHQIIAKRSIDEHSENELRKKRAQLFFQKDFRSYQNSEKIIENGIITQMRAEWILSEDKKLDVTLKRLRYEKRLPEFNRCAEKWSKLSSPDLIKMYGFTLTSPYTLVFESMGLGSLDEFLQKQRPPMGPVKLIEVSQALARALQYLQENKIIHGRIRCASLFVVRHDEKNFIVRLGDPGLQESYTNDDLPWIPFEYHHEMERARMDDTADIWAYATTLWEIFSQGRKPLDASKRRLQRPKDCPDDIYEIMREGWHESPDQRFTPRAVFGKLNIAREKHNRLTIGSISSAGPAESSNGCINKITPSISDPTIGDNSHRLSTNNYRRTIIEVDDNAKLIFQKEIGRGNYGIVYEGQYESGCNNECVEPVAIKQLTGVPGQDVKCDFEREIKIMQTLQHPNIVKVIAGIAKAPIFIVMELVRHGSFLLYLSSQRPTLTTPRVLKFAEDIASGMEYLVSKKIVHRDLAARNILVDCDECVKISDFGLAQVADSNGCYIGKTMRSVPIKWYAPEALAQQKYSFSSDVWSYGVTLYEMFSGGQEPNLEPGKDLELEELLGRLQNGERLGRPSLCSPRLYRRLLYPCWDQNPKRRPDFTQILQIIRDEEYEEVQNAQLF